MGRVAGWFGPPARIAKTAAATARTVTMSAGPRAKEDTLIDMVTPPGPEGPYERMGPGPERADPGPERSFERADTGPEGPFEGAGNPLPPPPNPPRRRRGWRLLGVIAAVTAVLLIAQVVAMAGIDTPWIAFEPGAATPTDGLLSVEGAQTYDDPGQILYLTVRQNRLSMLEWVVKARDPYITIERESDLFPDVDREQVREENLAMMVRSKSDAELVALQYLGYDVFDTVGAQVTNVEPGSAADGKLSKNQVITAVDGQPVKDADKLIAALRGLEPGTTVTLSLQSTDGADLGTVQVTLGSRPDGTAGGFLGITTATWFIESPDIPVQIDIDSGDVGGNSAGLAFTLSIIDQLTPGDLVGGRKVAVTGTIQLNGNVGDVGGVAQKAVAARRAGAEVMLVPRNLEAEAKKTAGDMQVIPVSTLDEALAALSTLGGNADELALPSTTTPN